MFGRFTLSQRLEHLTLLLSFTVLAITGLVQKFVGSPLAELSIRVMGGIENVRIIHHVAAIVLLVLCAYHVIAVLHRVFVKRRAMTMLPGLSAGGSTRALQSPVDGSIRNCAAISARSSSTGRWYGALQSWRSPGSCCGIPC
jgi:hypothetical protein